jgi:1-deoxy-D-xylulose-5-phosphate reductoisomerase
MSVVPFGQAVSGSRADELSITLLGATGSIGSSTLDLVHKNRDRFRVEAVTAQRSAAALAQLARDVGARLAVVGDHGCYGELKDALANSGVEAAAGEDAVVDAARRPAQWVMAAITGAAGLRPTMTALERGATIALANKEHRKPAPWFFRSTPSTMRSFRRCRRGGGRK